MNTIVKYRNGNALIELFDDGTRVIQYEDVLKLDYPLNIDIRVSTKCSLGYNPKTNKSVCEFCHESARTDGRECNYASLKEKLINLPKGIELAIGVNQYTQNLEDFIFWCDTQRFVVNLTVNQLLLPKIKNEVVSLLENELIRGLGISYRKDYCLDVSEYDEYFVNHPNVVLHVIAGVDTVNDILMTPYKKILILGYKKFGRGIDYYNENVEKNIQQWYWWVKKLIDSKEVVSFDNLALEQLNVKRFLSDEKWEEFHQGERSLYINAVDRYFAPSSRSNEKTPWNNITVCKYFQKNIL